MNEKKDFIQNIIKNELKRFTGKKLYIFDFDETLISDVSTAYIVKQDGTKQPINHKQYKDYKLLPGEYLDINEFNDVIDPTISKSMMKLLIKHKNNAIILTARSVKEPIELFLNKFNINIPVFAIGTNDPKLVSITFNAHRKKDFISKVIEMFNLDYVEFWDDNQLNIYQVDTIKKLFPNTTIITHLVEFTEN